MTGQLGKTALAAVARSGLELPRAPFPGQPWRPRTEAEVHLLGQARTLDRARQALLGEVGRLRHLLRGHEPASVPEPELSVCVLTRQQLQVLAGAAAGEAPDATARRLCLSPSTIRNHRARLVKRLGARDLPHAVGLAMAAGWIPAGLVLGGGAP